MFEIEDITDTKFDELLKQVHSGEVDIVDSRINEWQDMLEELLGVVSSPADNKLSTLVMPWEVSTTVFHSWMLPRMGVEITLIDFAHQLFTYMYPNF